MVQRKMRAESELVEMDFSPPEVGVVVDSEPCDVSTANCTDRHDYDMRYLPPTKRLLNAAGSPPSMTRVTGVKAGRPLLARNPSASAIEWLRSFGAINAANCSPLRFL